MVQISLWDNDFISFRCISRSGFYGSYGASIFNFLRYFHSVFHSGYTHLPKWIFLMGEFPSFRWFSFNASHHLIISSFQVLVLWQREKYIEDCSHFLHQSLVMWKPRLIEWRLGHESYLSLGKIESWFGDQLTDLCHIFCSFLIFVFSSSPPLPSLAFPSFPVPSPLISSPLVSCPLPSVI